MDVFPELEIRFPADREAELLTELRGRAVDSWSWQGHGPFGGSPQEGRFYFHRRPADDLPPCTLCIDRKCAGVMLANNLVPDENSKVNPIPNRQCECIIKEFRSRIASPAATVLGGGTRLGPSQHSLEDYFSPNAIQLLECFCGAANQGDLGTHSCDQGRWMRFLRYVRRYYRNPPHCDIFRACLGEKKWWPEVGIARLVHEYDFAMQLLAHPY